MDYAYNRFTVSGSEADIKLFVASYCRVPPEGPVVLDFERVIPAPAEPQRDIKKAAQWRLEHWSVDEVEENIKAEKRTPTELIFQFGTRGTPPETIYRELARRHPEVKFVANFAEGANELAHHFSAWRGAIETWEREATEADWDAATGETQEQRDQIDAAADAWRKQHPLPPPRRPIVNPRFWLRHWRVRRALRTYPLYDVPHKQEEETLDESGVQDNFNYFMRVRHERLAFFQNWLRTGFGVHASLNGDGLVALNKWVNAYGGGLIGDEFKRMTIFATYAPAWVGAYAGYNVMIDIGIFVGEYLIAKRPRLHWDIFRGYPGRGGKLTGLYLNRPHLVGFPRESRADPLATGYGVVAGSRKRSYLGPRSLSDPEAIINHCKCSLYEANLPEGEGRYTFGDYSNEPI